MHELGIATAIIEQVSAQAKKYKASAVKSVTIKVGTYSGVCTESLEFVYGPLAEDTLLENSQLIIQMSPFKIYCPHCQQTFAPAQFRRSCEVCGSTDVEIISGRELDLVSMEIASPCHHSAPATTINLQTNPKEDTYV